MPDDRAITGGIARPGMGAIEGIGARRSRPVIGSSRALLAHLVRPGPRSWNYQRRALFLDRGNGLISDEVLTADPDETERTLLGRARALKAAAVILVRPGRGRDPAPTAADLDAGHRAFAALAAAQIVLHDYVIVAGDLHASLRGLGLLPGPLDGLRAGGPRDGSDVEAPERGRRE